MVCCAKDYFTLIIFLVDGRSTNCLGRTESGNWARWRESEWIWGLEWALGRPGNIGCSQWGTWVLGLLGRELGLPFARPGSSGLVSGQGVAAAGWRIQSAPRMQFAMTIR